jgi:membrane protein implicated in regulation of membrane protease activity
MENTLLYWLGSAVLLLFFELANPSHFLFLSFSFGAFIGGFAAWLDFPFAAQTVLALFATGTTFLLLRSWILQQVKRLSSKEHKSNTDALEGKIGIVIKEVKSLEFGQVKIGGQIWSCRGVHDEIIRVNEEVRILGVKGAHVILEKIKER